MFPVTQPMAGSVRLTLIFNMKTSLVIACFAVRYNHKQWKSFNDTRYVCSLLIYSIYGYYCCRAADPFTTPTIPRKALVTIRVHPVQCYLYIFIIVYYISMCIISWLRFGAVIVDLQLKRSNKPPWTLSSVSHTEAICNSKKHKICRNKYFMNTG